MSTSDPWIIVPARGRSQGVPRLNLRLLAGQPLISYVLATAAEVTLPGRVVVVTDDDEIDEVARFHDARVLRVAEVPTEAASLNDMIIGRLPAIIELGASDDDVLLSIQPNWPLVTSDRVRAAVRALSEGAGSVMTVFTDRRPAWTIDPNAEPTALGDAVDGQRNLITTTRETAAIFGTLVRDVPRRGIVALEPASFLALRDQEAVGIDTFADFAVAEYWLGRRSIIIRTDAGRHLGMGHVYRSLALAHELAQHAILIVTSVDQPLGGRFFAGHPFEHVSVSNEDEFVEIVQRRNVDLVVLDVLNTEASLIDRLTSTESAPKIVSFEDHGSGAHLVDLLVCDIYENPAVPQDRQMVGISNALLSPTFESLPRQTREAATVEEVLVLFGGTDPSDLARKSLRALDAIAFAGHVTVVRGLGADSLDVSGIKLNFTVRTDVANMAKLMSTADLALSSAGRTLAELASLGVPTVCMAQNTKELRHTHSTVDHGVMLLGLGTEVPDKELRSTLTRVIDDPAARARLRAAALQATSGRTNAAVVSEILRRTGLIHRVAPTTNSR